MRFRTPHPRMAALLPALLFAIGCTGGASPPPARPRVFGGPSDGRIAYRHRAEVRFSDEDPEGGERSRSHLFLVRRADGTFRVQYQEDENEQRFLPIDDRAAAILYFPAVPAAALRERVLRIPRVDRDEPLELRERVSRGEEISGRIEVRFEREGHIATGDHDAPTPVHFVQRGRGSFDPATGRYETVEIEFEARDGEGTLEGRVSLRFDAEETARGVERERQIRAGLARGAQSYAADPSVSDPAPELARIESRLRAAGGEPVDLNAIEWFHAHAHPVELWNMLLAEPVGSGGRAHLQRLLVVAPMMAGERVPDEVIEFLRAHLGDRDVARAVLLLGDARLEGEVRKLAASSDAELREAARAALLERLDLRPTAEDVRAAWPSEERFLELAVAYAWREDDPRPIVPVLVEVLPKAEPAVAEQVVEILQSLTFRPYGLDPARWQTFVETHASLPYRDWIVAATREKGHEARIAAYEALGYEAPFDAGASALTNALRARDPRLRLAAAGSLARWRRTEAAPVLVEFLSARDFETRLAAFSALAHLAPSTLGYDPSVESVDRAEAIGRFRAWARALAGKQRLAKNLWVDFERFFRR